MQNLSPQIANNVKKSVLTLASCIKLKLKDGRTLGFTTHTRNIFFIGEPDVIYYAKGFTPTASVQNANMSVDNANGDIIIDHEQLFEDDLEKGVYNNAEYYMFDFDWTIKDANGYYYADSILKTLSGTLGEVRRDKQKFNVEFRSLAQYLTTLIVDLYKVSCNATLGDARCKRDLTDLTDTDVISAVAKNNVFYLTTSARADGKFNNGIIEFTSGENKGKKYNVKQWTNADKRIHLHLGVNYPIAVGDTVKITEGCNKFADRCKELGNFVNYRGFPNIPGVDFLASGGTTKTN